MQKKDIIARAAIAFTAAEIQAGNGERIDFAKVVKRAEALYARLKSHGYGAPEPTGPRKPGKHYDKLEGQSRQWFDELWEAYDHKKGRDGAALSWLKLGDINEVLARTIIEAAHRDAREPRDPGTPRKMLQGWLTERRWQDHAATPAATGRRKAQEDHKKLGDILGEIATLETLVAHAPNDQLQAKLDDYRAQRDRLQGAKETTDGAG